MEKARRTAMQRMIEDAKKLGEDVVYWYATAQTMRSRDNYGIAVKTF